MTDEERIEVLFDANEGRPMREWVCLGPTGEEACLGSLREPRAFVGRAAASSRT